MHTLVLSSRRESIERQGEVFLLPANKTADRTPAQSL